MFILLAGMVLRRESGWIFHWRFVIFPVLFSVLFYISFSFFSSSFILFLYLIPLYPSFLAVLKWNMSFRATLYNLSAILARSQQPLSDDEGKPWKGKSMELVVRKGVLRAGGGAGSGGYGGAFPPPHESPVILRERILIWDKCEQKCVVFVSLICQLLCVLVLGKHGHGSLV